MFRREGGVGGGGYFRLMKAKGEDKSSDWQPARQRGESSLSDSFASNKFPRLGRCERGEHKRSENLPVHRRLLDCCLGPC